ncbi:hypothetical protein M1446_02770 [Candidatus Dependentiae bacterium]|nr:hypothetical protein [Candidatus Dependentiae bacterium]
MNFKYLLTLPLFLFSLNAMEHNSKKKNVFFEFIKSIDPKMQPVYKNEPISFKRKMLGMLWGGSEIIAYNANKEKIGFVTHGPLFGYIAEIRVFNPKNDEAITIALFKKTIKKFKNEGHKGAGFYLRNVDLPNKFFDKLGIIQHDTIFGLAGYYDIAAQSQLKKQQKELMHEKNIFNGSSF